MKAQAAAVPKASTKPEPSRFDATASESERPITTPGMPRYLQGAAPKSAGTGDDAVPLDLGPSQSLRGNDRALFEGHYGAALSSVQLHDNDAAAAQADQWQASAFTIGNHVAFARGAYRPNSVGGHLLLAHELAHVVQQQDAAPPDATDAVATHGESDADLAAFSGRPPTSRLHTQAIQRNPQHSTPAELIDSFTSWGNLDEEALGQRLFDLAWMSPDHYDFIVQVMDELGWGDRDDVASAFVRSARDDNLDEFARPANGRAMLLRLKRELFGGFTAVHEGAEGIRLNNAIRRADGADEGRTRADTVMNEAEQRGLTTKLKIPTPASLTPAEIEDRLQLLSLLLTQMRKTHSANPDIIAAITRVEERITEDHGGLVSVVIEPAFAANKITVAMEVAERSSRTLANLETLLSTYRSQSALGAAQSGYVALTERVEKNYIGALNATLDADALDKLAVAEASGAALPRALTEIDLSILAYRQGGYELISGSGEEMVAWVKHIRDQLEPLEAGARDLAAARERSEPDIADREAKFMRSAHLLEDSIAAVSDWDRALHAYEALAGGFNVIVGAYEDVTAILTRCAAMRDSAMAGNAEELRERLKKHKSDPAVERFYKAIPVFIGASAMLVGLTIALVAAMASAGVGALVAGPGASAAAVAGSVALEALTFTAVNRTLSGAISPPPKMPLLLDLALNIGLFSLLRTVGGGIKSFLGARGLSALTGLATHTASYGILTSWGLVQFRLEEGRWPSGDEIAKMSVESLVMLAGIAVVSRSVTRAIHSHQQLRALENFHTRYGLRLATVEISRAQLLNRFRSELAAGRGDDAAVVEELRAEAEKLNKDLLAILDEARADPALGAEELRTALTDSTIDTASIGGELLARSLNLPEAVALRRAGGLNFYSYEVGATQPLVDRLTALGAKITETLNAQGRRTLFVEFGKGNEPPMLFIERVVSPELTARLTDIARMLNTPGASKDQRRATIGAVRTPNDNAQRGELEGYVLDTLLAENQRAFADLIATLREENPDIIIGMEQGGAFLVDVIRASDPTLASKVRHVPVFKNERGEKFDAAKQQEAFLAAIGSGTRVAIVDSYMGGTTASALRDNVLLPLARSNADLNFDVHWMRETFGFEANGTVGTLRGQPNARSPGGSQIKQDARQMKLVLGDDMEIVYSPNSQEPITLFDSTGRIVRVEYPGPGETTRDVLIRMMRPPP
jgi:hypothetical protein